MLKRLFSSTLFLSACVAMSQLSPALEKQMQNEPSEFITVVVEFTSTVEVDQLQARFRQDRIPVKDWPRLVNRELLRQASVTQTAALEFLNGKSEDAVKSISSFYIINVVVLEAKPKVISKLATLSHVEWIDFAYGDFLLEDPIEATKKSTSAVNGVEPGLVAINAPAMWQLGYTGRGRLLYNYDTGVWASHPSFTHRFLGNFKPLSQSWYGLERDYPDGRISNHGTHTLGTMAGLDTTTNDTIGVAFGAYWMANDYVNSTVATLPPIAEMIQAFEWALNPDGDTATSDDVPDVINNSWRWRDDPDTVQCGGYVVRLMDAIEAAGIANVFSGGNAGPNNTSVSAPQRISTNKTSTFSVGSIDANQSYPYPISNFSSRGPTQCPGTGNLKIHPEVVAPGQNVRSAWGVDGYNTISGTSMAAPHVSGAVLLLKEAFPQLSGTDLLQALYTTAIDFGVSGEDNTYGNGMIDVYAAYQYLVQSHAPVDPHQVDWDIAIKDVSYSVTDDEVTCWDGSFIINVTLENLGSNDIDSLYVEYWLDGTSLTSGPVQIMLPMSVLLSGNSVTFSLPNTMSVAGLGGHELKVKVGIYHPEYDYINNERVVRFNKREKETFPFVEDFEQASLKKNWYVENEDMLITWDTVGVSNWTGNSRCVMIGYSEYYPRASQLDRLWSPRFEIPNSQVGLGFDLAYQERLPSGFVHDTLRIVASIDCGKTFPYVLYEKSGSNLSTTGVVGADFKPVAKSEWRREYVDLSSLNGQEVILAFEGVNRGGNNLYLDNISVYDGYWDPIALEEITQSSFELFPNPAGDVIYLESVEDSEKPVKVQIFDLKGAAKSSQITLAKNGSINLKLLPKGVYMLKVQQGGKVEFLRFVKE